MDEVKTLRAKSPEELKKALRTLTARMHELRFQNASNQLKNIREMRSVRKQIARIKTLIHEKAEEAA